MGPIALYLQFDHGFMVAKLQSAEICEVGVLLTMRHPDVTVDGAAMHDDAMMDGDAMMDDGDTMS
jgi:hypothetical protein